MSGFVGFVNYKQDISNYKNILINMNNSLCQNTAEENSYFINKHIAISGKRDRVFFPLLG